MENLDSRLLRNQEEENEAARQLKEKKREQAGEEDDEEAGADGEPRSLRQRVQAARQALDLKEQAKKKAEETASLLRGEGKVTSSRVLRWAWINLIPSLGLSLIYINIHVFLKAVFGEKLFCKLGEEWLPKQASEAAGEAGKIANKSIGLVEVMGLLMLDLAVLVIILGSLAVIAMIVDFMQAGILEKIATIIGGLTKIGWSEIKALFLLFANSAIK